MKQVFAVLIVLGFLGVAVFGFYAMHHGQNCIAMAAQGLIGCPLTNAAASSVNFHIDAFRSFSSAVFSAESIAISFVLILFALALAVLIERNTAEKFLYAVPSLMRQSDRSRALALQKRIRWFSKKENSPNVF
ncbi:MAG: hypothetical protein Q7R98_03100 [Candidatus Jorgensenbacteria bacterium]|nr:hypothetical protein [Candidatus Jorgensenbacteria bacterium]